LFESEEFDLPYVENDDSKSFLHHFENRMSKYYDALCQIPPSELNEFRKDDFINDIKFIIEQLSDVLNLYLDGLPAQAYTKFKNLVEYPKLAARLMHWRVITLDSNQALFRTKREYDIEKALLSTPSSGFLNFIESIDLFHVPFEKRKAIGTNRFSIPGFPCIYLSSNLQTSWSEALGDVKYPFHAACFRNHRPVYMVDLVPVRFATPTTATLDYLANLYNYDDSIDALVDYALVFPLITACHTKIMYTSAYSDEVKFKSEYIIPQLLLQWYRDKHITIDGIRYLSCTADSIFPHESFEKFNYVIPAIDIKEKGYCDSLLYNYSATNVYSHLKSTADPILSQLKEIMIALNGASFSPLNH
jgi:hypothetical protein